MKRAAVLGFCILLATPSPALPEQQTLPVAQAEPAQIAIDPLPAGRRLIRLPGVEFPLRLTPACPDNLDFQSLLISIADSRRTFSPVDFDAAATIETRIRVPARQTSPIAVDEFCEADAEPMPTAVTISDAFTASISMRCGSESRQSVSYDTLALEIQLVCRLPGGETETGSAPTAAGNPSETPDQDASSSARF